MTRIWRRDLSRAHALLRLDGQYGTGAVLTDPVDFSFVTRSKDYAVLDQLETQARLHLPADQSFSHPESLLVRQLYGCPDVAVGPAGLCCRVVVARIRKAQRSAASVGVVYELFLTNVARQAFTAVNVVALYCTGAFEPTLPGEDEELDPDRWCSYSACEQETWNIIAQWVGNLRLELGHQIKPEPLRTTEFAPALDHLQAEHAPASGYEPPAIGGAWKAGCYSGQDFTL